MGYLNMLTDDEKRQIQSQFEISLVPERQVMWTGVPREWVQVWADANKMQTLTTAMGPLIDRNHPSCLKISKSPKEWQEYVRGASAIYAEYVARGKAVTVLTRPPPERFNPKGHSTFQNIEYPILQASSSLDRVLEIYLVHPTVVGAESYRYLFSPDDEYQSWVEKFGASKLKEKFFSAITNGQSSTKENANTKGKKEKEEKMEEANRIQAEQKAEKRKKKAEKKKRNKQRKKERKEKEQEEKEKKGERTKGEKAEGERGEGTEGEKAEGDGG